MFQTFLTAFLAALVQMQLTAANPDIPRWNRPALTMASVSTQSQAADKAPQFFLVKYDALGNKSMRRLTKMPERLNFVRNKLASILLDDAPQGTTPVPLKDETGTFIFLFVGNGHQDVFLVEPKTLKIAEDENGMIMYAAGGNSTPGKNPEKTDRPITWTGRWVPKNTHHGVAYEYEWYALPSFNPPLADSRVSLWKPYYGQSRHAGIDYRPSQPEVAVEVELLWDKKEIVQPAIKGNNNPPLSSQEKVIEKGDGALPYLHIKKVPGGTWVTVGRMTAREIVPGHCIWCKQKLPKTFRILAYDQPTDPQGNYAITMRLKGGKLAAAKKGTCPACHQLTRTAIQIKNKDATLPAGNKNENVRSAGRALDGFQPDAQSVLQGTFSIARIPGGMVVTLFSRKGLLNIKPGHYCPGCNQALPQKLRITSYDVISSPQGLPGVKVRIKGAVVDNRLPGCVVCHQKLPPRLQTYSNRK